jgi:peptide/nickel transport system substrate-binding protein
VNLKRQEATVKNKIPYAVVIVTAILTMMFAACAKEATPVPTATAPKTTATAPKTTAPAPTAPKTTAPAPTTTPAKEAKWWDKFGEPTYGGTLIVRTGALSGSMDQAAGTTGGWMTYPWLEGLFMADWAVDRGIWSFPSGFWPIEYYSGILAKSWEHTDPLTVTVHLRQGAHWQDKPPVNGREFTADDVVYSWDRALGTGSGFTKPNPYLSFNLSLIERVVATDKYTVDFKLKKQAAFAEYQVLDGINIVPKEWVEQGDTNNWKNVVGTGPWLLTDYVESSSMICNANPNYYGHDERHPENQLPYIGTFKMLCIPDISTSIAAMRTGKVDVMATIAGGITGGLTLQQAQALQRTSPDIKQYWWANPCVHLSFRCDKAPFTDIRVRKALQMAIDRKTIAKTHYGGSVDGTPAGLLAPFHKQWVVPYDEWPKELQHEYSYDPAAAKALLAEAGYPNGFKTNVVMSSSQDTELLEIIKSYFTDIGVDMDIIVMDSVSFMPYVQAGKHDQMTVDTQRCHPASPSMAILTCKSTTARNYTHNNDPYYDELANKFDVAATLEEAQQIFREADMYALQQHWTLNTFPLLAPTAMQPWVKGYSGEFSLLWEGYYRARLWIDQDMKKSMGY